MNDALIESRSVSKTFGDFTAVDAVSMTIGAGEVVGLLGANGAGKTTLIRMLLGLLAPTAGSVHLFGGAPDRAHRARLGYVPQNLGLYRDLTVAENMAFSAGAYRCAATLPENLHDDAHTLVGDLSLGAQRTVAFAVALAHRPSVLVLDEPTSGVDALSRARLWDTIRQQADDGVGVLVTTHYMEEAQQCDRLLLMSNAELVAEGTEHDVIGSTRAALVRTEDWRDAFAALRAADVPVVLSGRTIRVADTDPERIRAILAHAGLSADIDTVPATIEERMLTLARRSRDAV
ncbi:MULTISPECIES: ABC transporter ATP-binding protein [unclassified Gordonia (in: high G+C Gram-positive bacteria)]